MSSEEPVVWLPPAGTGGLDVTADALTRVGGPVLTPDVDPPAGAQVVLEGPALDVLAAISATGAEHGVLCGWGLGSMVALQVAAGFPGRVSALVLVTHHRFAAQAVRSVAEGVLGLVAVGTLQRLRIRPRRVVELLDRVRPVDFLLIAPRVVVPALVLVGEHDLANRGPSAVLARTLPQGRLAVVPGADAGWPRSQPGELADRVAAFVAEVG